jgi:hypothetical protein
MQIGQPSAIQMVIIQGRKLHRLTNHLVLQTVMKGKEHHGRPQSCLAVDSLSPCRPTSSRRWTRRDITCSDGGRHAALIEIVAGIRRRWMRLIAEAWCCRGVYTRTGGRPAPGSKPAGSEGASEELAGYRRGRIMRLLGECSAGHGMEIIGGSMQKG